MTQSDHASNLSAAESPVQVGARIDEVVRRFGLIRQELRRVIVGQHEIVDQLLIAVLCRGHTMIVGVPGLAKTLLVRTLARCLDLEFARIQFTPDMMPSDILGIELVQTDANTGAREMRFVPGPVFANLVLADEINRTPPKTQAALLEAMAEHQVSVAGQTRPLDDPFLVVATQNPIEQEGTYPLPEAQLDRFMFGLWMDYPTRAEERLIAADAERIAHEHITPIFGKDELLPVREIIAQVPVSEHVVDYTIDLVRATRPGDQTCPAEIRNYISYGAGPRAGQYLLLAARCRALLAGRPTPACDDVRASAPAVLRHRLVLNYTATGQGVTAQQIVNTLLERIDEPSYE